MKFSEENGNSTLSAYIKR